MDDSLCLRALHSIGIDMGHHVMADHFFPFLCHVIIDVIRVSLQLINLFLGNIESQLLLRLGKGNPQPPPCPELLVR